MKQPRSDRRTDKGLVQKAAHATDAAQMLSDHQRFVECAVRSRDCVPSSTVQLIGIRTRRDMVYHLDERIIEEARASLHRLERQRQFPIHLGTLATQILLKSDFPEKR